MSHFIEFMVFAFAAMVSPGPNNLLLMHSGLNFGLKRTMPLITGALCAYFTMLLALALGLGVIFETIPNLKFFVRLVGSFYMIYLAWKIAKLNERKLNPHLDKPLSFKQAFFFQWVNPKVWLIFIVYFSIFHATESYPLNAILLIVIILILNTPVVFIWAGLGHMLEKIIKSPKHRQILNFALAFFLAFTVVLLWI